MNADPTQKQEASSPPSSEVRDPTSEVPRSKVLIVDDERSIRVTLSAILDNAGYEVETAEDAEQAREMLAQGRYDVVLSDIVLPRVSGVDLLKAIRQIAPEVQVIMMTGEPTVETASEAVRAGAADYIVKPVPRDAVLHSVANAAKMKRLEDERSRLVEENAAYQHGLERLVGERTQKLEEALQNLRNTMGGIILAMSSVVESRDPYTAGHQQRVADLARAIASEMDLPAHQIDGIRMAAAIHDLGKMAVPAEILSKPTTLKKAEFELIQDHPQAGYEILKDIVFPWPIARIILEHHEKMDGSGYPNGLVGENILLESKIITVADVVEAMASHRPYRPALGIDAALAEIEKNKGTLYDTDAVDACLRLFREKGFKLSIL